MDINFDEVAATCDLSHLGLTAAEMHGQMVGLHLTRQVNPFENWLADVCKDAELIEPIDAEDQYLLKQLYQQVPIELERSDLGFQLLLPDDDFPLEKRLAALAQWVQGFLAGLAGAGVTNDQVKGDVKETLEDLLNIAYIDKMDIDGDDSAEKDYAEISEYVRMAVLLLHTDLVGASLRD